ncbi:hypothetical protein CCHL11_02816 [Colletotrichum chlorophyti]|uniref:Microtubule associated protein n=1 Tax=Colletotrichum chlorophyti TaxID=708187 RepID=A0A1Q8S115_9PEZI|nr:hypothetical protein CCHL11_02816 [Colletotrichum chlorophyti]
MNKPERPKNGLIAAKMAKVQDVLGFKQRHSFILFINFAGALMGFTLARLMYLDVDNVFCGQGFSSSKRALPGECYFYRKFTLDRIGIIMHLACILPASFLVFWQFIPVIRRRMLLFHRINGYLVLILSVPGTVGALIVARHAVGGGSEVQAAVGLLAIMFLGALLIAFIQIKRLRIEQHRAWMLRAWFYAGAIITIRPIMMIAALIVSRQRGYYVDLPCAVVEFLMEHAGAGNATSVLFENCVPFVTGKNPNQQTIVEANFFDRSTPTGPTASLHASFGMASWLAGAIHAIGIEIYLHLTPGEAERLRQVSRQRQIEAGMRSSENGHSISDRLGSAEKWGPSVQWHGCQECAARLRTTDSSSSQPERGHISM